MRWHFYEGSAVHFSHAVRSNSLWPHGQQASLSITHSWSSLKLMSIESVIPSNHLIFCRPLLLLSSIFPSIRVFSSESVLHILRVASIVRVASNPPKPQGMTRDTERRVTMLSILWILVLLWILSIHLVCFYFASPLVQTSLLSTLKIYFSLYKVEKQPFSVPTLSPLSSANKVLRQLTKLTLWYF